MGRNGLSISGCQSVQQESYSPRILGPRDEVAGDERERRPAFLPTAVASPTGWEDLDSDLKGAPRALRARPQVGERPLAPGLRAGMGEAGRGGGGGAGGGVLGSGGRAGGRGAEWERERERCCSGRHGEHSLGDYRLYGLYLGMGAGVLHAAHRLLEGVHHRRHGHHHRHLLGQPVEDVRYRLHGCLQLQGFPLHAGAGRSASPRPPLRLSLLSGQQAGAPAGPHDPRGTPRPDSFESGSHFPPRA